MRWDAELVISEVAAAATGGTLRGKNELSSHNLNSIQTLIFNHKDTINTWEEKNKHGCTYKLWLINSPKGSLMVMIGTLTIK